MGYFFKNELWQIFLVTGPMGTRTTDIYVSPDSEYLKRKEKYVRAGVTVMEKEEGPENGQCGTCDLTS